MNQASFTCQRALFSIPDDHCWLNSAYMGPLARPVQQAGINAIAKRAYPAQISSDDFFAPADNVRKLCGQLVNANAESVALVTNTATACSIVARNVQPDSGQNVVMLDDQFPSNVYPWRNWRDQGVQMRHVSAPQARHRLRCM
jgi:selenocysteine lyase/cysteine desulfurase